MIGRILGGLYAYGMYYNVERTADIEAFRTQMEYDALTPEQQQRVVNARLERKREAAEATERQRKYREAHALRIPMPKWWYDQPVWFRATVTLLAFVMLVLLGSLHH